MARLVLTAFGDPDEVVRLEDGPVESPGPGDVVVAMEAAALNPADFLLARGNYGIRPSLPATLGGEGVGRIVETGGEVDTALAGRRVVVLPDSGQGTWADRLVVPATSVVPVPDDGDVRQLAMLTVNPATAYQLLRRYGPFSPGEWIAQTAANSAMGSYVIALARRQGVKTLNVVRREESVEAVERAGGDRVVVAGDDLAKRVSEALGGEKLSLVLDSVGGRTVRDLARSLKFRGTVVNYAFPEGAPRVSSIDLVFREISVTGFWLFNWLREAPREEVVRTYELLAGLVSSGELTVPIEASYGLADYRAAFEHTARAGRSGKVLFSLGGS